MRVPRFELEAYVRRQERSARFPLGSSGLAAFPLRDLEGSARALEEPGDAEEAFAQAVARARRVDPARVLPTVGASEALFLVPFALASPGDRVLVERPAYPPLWQVPAALGCRVERFDRAPDGSLDVAEVEARLDGDVALVSLASPHNPTGRATPARDLARLARACADAGARLLVDDTFRAAVPGAPPPSHLVHEAIVSVEALTKCHGLSALRAGWILADPATRDRLRDARALTSIHGAAPALRLAALALAQEDRLLARCLRVTGANLARWRAFCDARPSVSWDAPDAPLLSAFRAGGQDADELCGRALAEGVMLVPGRLLEMPGAVRVGFGAEPETFAAGLDALARALPPG